MVFNGLIKYDKDVNIVGDLAESWEISRDGLVITFHLRKGVRWHDGRPFTAADVLYTYQVTVDPKTPTAYAGDFLKVKKAEVLDDYTFRVTYDKPFAPASDELVGRHPAEPSPGREGYHDLPPRPASDRDGALQIQGVGDRAEDRSRLQSATISRGGRTSTATSCGSSPIRRRCSWSSARTASTGWG